MFIGKVSLYCWWLLFIAYILEVIKCGTYTVKKVLPATFLGIKVRMAQVEICLKTNSDLKYVVFTFQGYNSTSSQ